MSIIASAIIAATIPATTNLSEQVAILWTAHTNRLARIEAHRAKVADRKSAVAQVRENAARRNRRSVVPNNVPGVAR